MKRTEAKPYRGNKASPIYCTTYCNQGHRRVDGMPVGHVCYQLCARKLALEAADNIPAITGSIVNCDAACRAARCGSL